LDDCWKLARALPKSGVLDRGRRPYRARRFEAKLSDSANDPAALLEYIRGMARRSSDGLESLVEYNRLDLSVETLIIDESKVYAPLFTADDRAAAQAKLERQRGEVADLADQRETQLNLDAAARQARIDEHRSALPRNLEQLRALAAEGPDAERAIAINGLILTSAPGDVVALNRSGRAYEALEMFDRAREAFQQVLEVEPGNPIATKRLRELDRRSPKV
jgi:tetratricopeptide (TPR) repeat protein